MGLWYRWGCAVDGGMVVDAAGEALNRYRVIGTGDSRV
jgi:hypothetical protein